MKKEWLRATLGGDFWLLETHTRFPSLRLRVVDARAPKRISYSWFGSFDARGIDLICSKEARLGISVDGRGLRFDDHGRTVMSSGRSAAVERVAGDYEATDRTRITIALQPEGESLVRLRADCHGAPAAGAISISWALSALFAIAEDSPQAVRYGSQALGAGLSIQAVNGTTVRVERHGAVQTIMLSGQASTGIEVLLQVTDGMPGLVTAVAAGTGVSCEMVPMSVQDVPRWEVEELRERGWSSVPGVARELVAALCVGDPRWHHHGCGDPLGDIDRISAGFLDKVIDTRVFQAIGLSREGIAEYGRTPQWLDLVQRSHAAGLRVYMKPGDQELEAITQPEAKADWLRQNFAVPRERQVEVVRLCWEAVMRAWITADLCLDPRYATGAPDALSGRPWDRVEDRIVADMADRFSYFIDGIRKHAPHVVVDLECGDTRVFTRLLARHGNLGVMYMCYGTGPRLKDYLDLYECVARHEVKAQRIVLETDCYYTERYHQVDMLLRDPPAVMYGEADFAAMRAKHEALAARQVDAVWAWGLNLCHHEAKFEAICAGLQRRARATTAVESAR